MKFPINFIALNGIIDPEKYGINRAPVCRPGRFVAIYKQIFTSLMLGLLLLVVVAPNLNAQETNKPVTKVDVYYFHSTKRCPTCEAIERETKKTLDNSFATQMADGTIKLHILNLEEKANKALVEKYEIAGSSLLLVPVSGGKPVDLTNKAFLYAKDNSFAFRKDLKEKLTELLK